MAQIPKNFLEGGAYLTPGDSAGKPSLADILRDISTDLHTISGNASGAGAAVTAPALGAFTDPPTAIQMEALRTLVNQIRAALVAGGGGGGGALLTSVA